MQLCEACPLSAFFAERAPQLDLPISPKAKPIGEAIDCLLAAKTAANFRAGYLTSLRQYLRAFARGREDWPLQAFSPCTLEEWFAGRKEAPSTRKSNLGRLASLFSFAVRRGWTLKNPCKALDSIRLDASPPRILTVAESRQLLAHCRVSTPKLLRWTLLGLFCGLRPEEAEKAASEAVNITDKFVRVDSKTTKVRERRIVTIPDCAAEWLRLANQEPLSRSTRRRWQKKLRTLMGWKAWPQDVLRHTAASYLLASGLNSHEVSDRLGNSPSVLKGHYKELASGSAAVEFFSLFP